MSDSPILSAADIFGVNDLTANALRLDVPEWGGAVIIRKISCSDKDTFFNKAKDKDLKPVALVAWLLTKSLVAEDGSLLFSEKDAPKIVAKASDVVEKIGEQVLKHNGMKKEDEIKAVGEPVAG